MPNSSTHKISFSVNNKVLVVTVQEELFDETMEYMQEQILNTIYNKQLKGILIDVSGVQIIDSYISRMLVDIAKMAKLLGAKTLFTGLKLEIVASLVDLGGNVPNEISIVLNVDEGLLALNRSLAIPAGDEN